MGIRRRALRDNLDTDADNDGVLDVEEGGGDSDSDGVNNNADMDDVATDSDTTA